jgi:hypothetical protein
MLPAPLAAGCSGRSTQERMKLTDEEVEECFQGAYGHGTAAYEAAKNAKEAMLAEKKEADMAKKAATKKAKKSKSKGKASKSKSKSKGKSKAKASKAKKAKKPKKSKKKKSK